jgi:predicted metal-dependent hydrolase
MENIILRKRKKRRPDSRPVPLDVCGIGVELVYKDIKNINLRISADGKVSASAPYGVPEEAVVSFIAGRSGWIRDKLRKIRAADVPERRWQSGETLRVCGRDYRLELEESGSGRSGVKLFEDVGTALMTVPRGSSEAVRAAAAEDFMMRSLRERLDARAPAMEELTGLRPAGGYRIRKMRTRWGSYSSRTGRITVNLALACVDDRLLDYILVHELTHIREMNHGEAFWRNVSACMPDWKERQKELNSCRAAV